MKAGTQLITKLTGPTPYPTTGLSYKIFKRRDECNKRLYVTFVYSRAIAIKGDHEVDSIYTNHIVTTYIPKMDEIKELLDECVREHIQEGLNAGYELDYTKKCETKHITLEKPF